MNKKDYIDAMNEIKVSNELKNKALIKVKEKRSYKIIYAIATSVIIFVLAISIAIPINNNKNTITPIDVVKDNNGLPKIESFENLYNIIKETKSEFYETNISTDMNSDSLRNENMAQSLEKDKEYSDTNMQVQGVDEADIVKTDGEYIYYISVDKVVLADVKNSQNLSIISEIKYEKDFYPTELFIKENRLVVIGESRDFNNLEYMTRDLAYLTDSKSFTVAKIYNTENKIEPKLEREIKIEGNYLSSRMIEDNIYLISNKYMYTYLFRNSNIEDLNENDFKPKYKDTAISSQDKCLEYNDIYYFPESEDTSYLNIAGFNIYNSEPANIESYLGAGEEIYASENYLYITKTKYEYKDNKTNGYYNNCDINTYIYKFKLENSKVTYENAGSVPGEVLNQFSMDEKDGYFRIATTDRDNWNNETSRNNLYVLNENLEIVGKVEDLAKGEKIYSVRFVNNRAYMVTFVETDPLFVIDLSEPTNPIVLGELKIPGYSKYLHPYDENHIIGFGENTKTTNTGRVIATGMKMALFDVTNPSSPKELYSTNIGETGTYSSILYNHKSLLFSKEKNIIAFPISIAEEESNRTNLKFQGAIVYGLDLDKGFNLKGTIAHMQIQDGYKEYDYTKEIERIIYINNSLYTLSKGIIKSTNMDNMQEESLVEIQIDKKNGNILYME